MKKKVLALTLNQLKAEVKVKEDKCLQSLTNALSNPEISSLYNNYIELNYKKLSGESVDEKELDSLHNQYVSKLKENGFKESEFTYSPKCSKCNDKGLVNGKPCSCIYNKYITNLKKACNLGNKAQFKFENVDFNSVKDIQQKSDLEKLYNIAKTYCDKYPKVNTNNLVFSGSVGTGKSCLASAIANEFINKGKAAIYLSAYEFNQIVLKSHIAKIEYKNEILFNILNADLLVIDDLGTEPMLKNVTVEYLLLVLEERINKGYSTVITTNLNIDQILNKYGERIYSRLSDKQHSKIYSIKGKDLRH